MCTLVRVGRRWPGAPPALSYDALARSEPLGGFAARAPEDELFIVFTSGTTDLPKAVVHSSRSIGATVELAREHLALRRGDVVYSKELHLVLPALLAGAHAVLPRHGRFSPARVLRDLERFGATHTFGLSTEYLELADHCARHGRRLPEALRQILLGGAPIHGAMLERLQPVLAPSTAAWCVYGMTEMLPVARVSLGEKLAYSGAGDLVGTPFPGVSVSLADDGELLVRGPNQCTGYLDKRRDGGHPTGDLARIDGSGRVVLLGRKKDMVIRGDLNIYPALIEPVIDRIEGVRRSSVVGLYWERNADEIVVVAVEPEPAADAHALERRVRRELRGGRHAIGRAAQPDHIVVMELPERGRRGRWTRRRSERRWRSACREGRRDRRHRLHRWHVAHLTEAGHEVVAFGRRPAGQFAHRGRAAYRRWDMTEGPIVAPAGIEAVVHCAAAVSDWGRREHFLAANVRGTEAVLATFSKAARFVQISTSSVYDPLSPKVCVREDAPLPRRYPTPYAETKRLAELAIEGSGRVAVILRPHAIYGAGDTTLLPRLLRAYRFGRMFTVGAGRSRLSRTYIDNLLQAIEGALDHGFGCEVFNVADAETPTLDEALIALLRALGLTPRIAHIPVPLAWSLARVRSAPLLTRYAVSQLAFDCTLDISRARASLGYRPQHSYRSAFPRIAQELRPRTASHAHG